MYTKKLPKVDKLPDVLPVIYKGVGDTRRVATLPENARSDFPDYFFEINSDLKLALNTVKSKLDVYNRNAQDQKKFSYVTESLKSLILLKGKEGLLCQNYSAEIVTNAFLKMMELLCWMDPQIKGSYDTFSVAEAPGNFILSLNHFAVTKHPTAILNWMASSYSPLGNEKNAYLGDTYSIIARNPEKWVWGTDGDGDITSVNNLRSFPHEFDLFTSDVKYVPFKNNYSEEENINIPVVTGHTLGALLSLKKNGNCVLKHFTLLEPQTIALLYLLSYCFQEVWVTKPESSKPSNSEVYIVGKQYKANINRETLESYLKYLTYIRFMNTGDAVPCMFLRTDLSVPWLNELRTINEELVKKQIKEIQDLLTTVKNVF